MLVPFDLFQYFSEEALTRCPDCGKDFASRAIMNNHRKHNCDEYFNRREKIQCSKIGLHGEICGRLLGRKEVWKHNLHFHNKKNRVVCDLCGNELTKEALKYHMDVHLGTQKIPCEFCDKMISHKRMQEHVDYMHLGKKRSDVLEACKICGVEVLHMIPHLLTHKEKKKCPHCPEYLSPQSLAAHIKEVHFKYKQEIVKCEYPGCDKEGTKSFMRSHSMSHKPRKTCEWCAKEYSHDRMRKHLKVCPQAPSTSNSSAPVKKLKKCPYCGRNYGSGDLSAHIKRVHLKVELKDEDLMKCPECDKKGSAEYIKDHLRTHKRIKCQNCLKEYSGGFFKKHICQPSSSSSAEKMFKCNEPNCPYIGATKHALNTHLLTHKPPVPCPHCGKLISRGNLTKHVKRCKMAPSTSKQQPKISRHDDDDSSS